MKRPLVSVITATYNSEEFIERTINSILKQTYTNLELLITDDCSSDNTFKIIEKYSKTDDRVKCFRLNFNQGAGVARNNSIRESSGSFIAFCDSDDLWKPFKLEKQIDFMLKRNVDFSYSNYDTIDENDQLIGTVQSPLKLSYKSMLRNNYIGCLTAVYNQENLGKICMPEIWKRQDWALWLKILKKTDNALNCEQNLAKYRIRKASLSSSKIELLKYNWIIYRKVEKFSRVKSLIYCLLFIFYFFLRKVNS